MKIERTPPAILEGQLLHFSCLAMLLGGTWAIWRSFGGPFPVAFWSAVAFPVVHQVFVWLAWRLELKSETTRRTIGFTGYVAFFFLLFVGRFVSLIVLAWLDRGSMGLPVPVCAGLTALLVVPGVYAMYSVARYFGMARAAGADHFDPRYRDMPLVNKGIFRFTSNGMYLYAFLLFWSLAAGFNSSAAVVVAAFSHAYIWVHFYSTEKPDMDFIHAPD